MADEYMDAKPTLRAWLEEYAAIEREFLDSVVAQGIDLAPRDQLADEIAEAKERLREKGARFRNGDASVSVGPISSACIACTGDCGSKTFFLSLACNRSCYFCFNVNQVDFAEHQTLDQNWKAQVDEFARACGHMTHVALTGGEPLLHKQETVEFFEYVRSLEPEVHTRLYTAGDFLDEACLAALRDSGLDELRMSVKVDIEDGIEVVDAALATIELAQKFIPDVMVEMPVIPGTGPQMKRLLAGLDRIGVFGINLLEFGYPMGDWTEFEARGFSVKNPPFPVLYNYAYAGGLPIDGSELLCLDLVEWAIDEGLSVGVHYCSLENKNRDQVLQQNRAHVLDSKVYKLDEDDFFYKTVKVFDDDVLVVRYALEAESKPYELDADEPCLMLHPDDLPELDDLPVACALSANVVERRPDGWGIRELKLELIDGGIPMTETEPWEARATAYELLALSFAYPDETLAGAVASGEWAEAAKEMADVMELDLPAGWDEGLASYEGGDADGVLHALRVEATRLFVGAPTPEVSPYEGVWRAGDDGVQPLLFVNPHSMEVERFMNSCGVGRPEGTNEPLDRVDTELELLQYLSMNEAGIADAPEGFEPPGDSWKAAHDMFVAEHACTWIPRFAERVEQESREPFYRAAAALLAAVLR